MKGRSRNGKSHVDGVTIRPSGESETTSHARDVAAPKKLAPVGGKKGQTRLDKPTRGRRDANAFAKGGGIHIKPENKGKLHRALGVPEGEKIPASKLAQAKHSKSAEERKEATFAVNAKNWR